MLVILLLLISSAYIELTGHIEGTAQGDNLNFKIVVYYNNTRYLLANHIFFATNGTYSCYGYTDQYGSGNVTMGRPFFISVPSFVPTSYGKNDFESNSFYREVGLNFFNVTGICPGSRNSLDPYVKLVRESDLQVLQEPWWVISTTPTFQYHLDRQVNSASADFLALTVAIVAFIVLAVIRDPSILGWLDFSKFIYNVPYNPPSTEMTVNKGNIAQTEKGHSIIQDESDKKLTDEHNKLAVIGNLSSSLAQVANQVGLGLKYFAYLIEESDKKTPKQERSEEAYQAYRQGERDSFVQEESLQEGQTGQDVVPGQTFTGQDDQTGGSDVQNLETPTEVAKELYREGERNLLVEESSIEVAKELYRQGERDSFVQEESLQEGQTGQNVVPGQTFTGQDDQTGGSDVQSLDEVSGDKSENVLGGQELTEYDPGFVPGQTGQNEDIVPGLTGQGSDVQKNQFSNPIAQFLYTLGHGLKIATLPFSYLNNLYEALLDGLFGNNRKVKSDDQSTSSVVSAGGVQVERHQSKDKKQQILERSGENFDRGIRNFLRALLDKIVLNYIGINMNTIRDIDINLKFFDNINNLDQMLNLHGMEVIRVLEGKIRVLDEEARREFSEWWKLRKEQNKKERPGDQRLAELIDAIERIIDEIGIENLDKILNEITKSLDNNQPIPNNLMADLVASIWNVDKGLVNLLIQIQQDPQKANNLKSQLERLYVESYFNKDNMRLSEEERRTYTIIYNVLTTNMTMEKIHLVESINVLRKYELYKLFRQLEAEIDMNKEMNAQDLQEKLRESLQSINDKYGLEILTEDEINSHLKVIKDIQGESSSVGSSHTAEASLGELLIGLNSNDIMLYPKIAKAFLKGLSIYYGSLGDIIDNEGSWAKKSNQIFLVGIRSILDQKDIDKNTRNQLIDIAVRVMLNDEESLKRIIDTFRHSLSDKDELIQKLEKRAELIEFIRKKYGSSRYIDLDNLAENLGYKKEDYTLNDEELTKLAECLKSAPDADLFTLSLRVLENKSLNIPSLDRVLPKYPIPSALISEKTYLGFFYGTQDPAFITKLNQSLVGNHFMGRIKGLTEVQQIETVLTSFAYELIPLDYQISIVDRTVYIKKGDKIVRDLRLDKPVENISEIKLLAKEGQIYLKYDDQILPTGIQIDENKIINEKIQQMRFMTKDGKLYAVYGDKSIELRWEDIFTPIMHRIPLHVFNLNSKTANEFIQQFIQEMSKIQEMGDGLSYEQFMNLLKQTRLKNK